MFFSSTLAFSTDASGILPTTVLLDNDLIETLNNFVIMIMSDLSAKTSFATSFAVHLDSPSSESSKDGGPTDRAMTTPAVKPPYAS